MAIAPLITCIIPTRGRPNLLRRALDSVLRQTYDKIEIIIVVSPPHESIRPIIRDYENTHERLRSFYIQDDSGPSVARNKGIRKASGKYLAFLDDDDVFEPTKLEKQVQYLDEYSFVSCLPKERTNNGLHLIDWPDQYTNEVDVNAVFSNTAITCTSGMMFRKPEVQAIGGFDEQLVRGEIWDLTLKILERFNLGYVVDQNLFILDCSHGLDQVSGKTENFNDLYKTFYRHNDKVRSDIARKQYVRLGFKGYREIDKRKRYQYLFLSLMHDYDLNILKFILGKRPTGLYP